MPSTTATNSAAIAATLCKLGNDATEALERIDAEIARYLTASRPCQHLPSARAIRNKINALIAQENESLSTQDSTEPEDTYHVFALSSARSCLSAEYDSATALILDEHIRQTAENLDVSPAEALARLIKGEAAGAANVTLHVYRASDVHNAPAFVKATG